SPARSARQIRRGGTPPKTGDRCRSGQYTRVGCIVVAKNKGQSRRPGPPRYLQKDRCNERRCETNRGHLDSASIAGERAERAKGGFLFSHEGPRDRSEKYLHAGTACVERNRGQ